MPLSRVDFTATVSTISIAQRHNLAVSCAEFHLNRSRSLESRDKIQLRLQVKYYCTWPIFTKLKHPWQLLSRISMYAFY
jgi:hypothetical protein